MSANDVRSWMVAHGCSQNWMAALDGLKVTDVEELLLNWEDNKASIESNVIRQRALQNRLKELVESISATTRNAAGSNTTTQVTVQLSSGSSSTNTSNVNFYHNQPPTAEKPTVEEDPKLLRFKLLLCDALKAHLERTGDTHGGQVVRDTAQSEDDQYKIHCMCGGCVGLNPGTTRGGKAQKRNPCRKYFLAHIETKMHQKWFEEKYGRQMTNQKERVTLKGLRKMLEEKFSSKHLQVENADKDHNKRKKPTSVFRIRCTFCKKLLKVCTATATCTHTDGHGCTRTHTRTHAHTLTHTRSTHTCHRREVALRTLSTSLVSISRLANPGRAGKTKRLHTAR